MISHKKKFICVRINKTAGTSIELSLKKYAARPYLTHQFLCPRNSINKFHRSCIEIKTAALMDQCLTDPKDYFKFCFVRNPWDRMVSHFFYLGAEYKKRIVRKKDGHRWNKMFQRWKETPFEQYILGEGFSKDCMRATQLDWISDDKGKIMVDFVGRFENLKGDFFHVCDKLKIKRMSLPKLNKTIHLPYWEYYNDDMIKVVENYYQKEVELFGYKFRD